MKKILSVSLILIGIAEIIISAFDVKPPIIISLVLGDAFIAPIVKNLIDA